MYQCYHGDHQISQLILEWKPLERIVFRFTDKIPLGTLVFTVGYFLERVGENTLLTEQWPKPGGSGLAHRALLSPLGKRLVVPRAAGKSQRGLKAFRDRIESVYVEQSQTVAPAP